MTPKLLLFYYSLKVDIPSTTTTNMIFIEEIGEAIITRLSLEASFSRS
jgi:hypothetical protein